MDELGTVPRVVGEQQVPVEVDVVGQRGEVRGGGDAGRGFQIAAQQHAPPWARATMQIRRISLSPPHLDILTLTPWQRTTSVAQRHSSSRSPRTFGRLSYQLTVREAGKPYVEAAVALGAGPARILARHILPNTARPLIAHSYAQFANVLLAVAGLSFLGLGAAPPTPEWGAMLAEGRRYLRTAPWLVLAAGAAIVLVTAVGTVLGRALQQRWSADRTRP